MNTKPVKYMTSQVKEGIKKDLRICMYNYEILCFKTFFYLKVQSIQKG